MFDQTVEWKASSMCLAVSFGLALGIGLVGCATAPSQPELPVYPATSNAHRGAIVQTRATDGKTNWVHCVDNCPAATAKRNPTTILYKPAVGLPKTEKSTE